MRTEISSKREEREDKAENCAWEKRSKKRFLKNEFFNIGLTFDDGAKQQ